MDGVVSTQPTILSPLTKEEVIKMVETPSYNTTVNKITMTRGYQLFCTVF